MTPISQNKNEKAEIHLIQGINSDGLDFFAYVAATPERAKELKVALRGGKQPDLEKYGVVLYLGRGKPDEQLSKNILANFQ